MLMTGSGRAARIHYLPGTFRLLTDGDHVVCAVTGARIPLHELRYWSVERQEPYVDAAASLEAEQRAGWRSFRAALAADPRNPDAHEKLGALLAARWKAFEAAEHFQQAVALAGPDPQLLTRLGHALLRLGRLDEARDRSKPPPPRIRTRSSRRLI